MFKEYKRKLSKFNISILKKKRNNDLFCDICHRDLRNTENVYEIRKNDFNFIVCRICYLKEQKIKDIKELLKI